MSRVGRRGERRRRRWAWWLLGVLGGLLLAAGAGAGWLYLALVERPGGNPERVELEIPSGTRGRGIVRRLHEAGLAPRPEVTYWALRYAGTLRDVEAGRHELPGDVNVLELRELLRHPATPRRRVLALRPAESVWEAATRIGAADLATSREEVLRLASDRDWVVHELGLPAGRPRPPRPDGVAPTYLEGFLYPDTLHVTPDASTREVIRRVAARFREVWRGVRAAHALELQTVRREHGLDDHELVTLASLVAEETRAPDEAPVIAGVFYNRLDRGMRLQTDPTLMYHPDRVGLPPRPRHRRNATNPYNTYAHDGLPPGPICSPGRRALEAVAAPAHHDYLYFVARGQGEGRHFFSRTFDEHRGHIRRSRDR